MNFRSHVQSAVRHVRVLLTRRILSHRIQARYPSLMCDPTAIWDYGYNDLDAIELGEGVSVLAFVEIIVHKRNRFSRHEGRLILGSGTTISTGVNLRAAGGVIEFGAGSAIGQHSVVVAANHAIKPGVPRFNTPYDEARTGVVIGKNVWIGALCVILPGISIGDNAVIAAGSVVTQSVPPNEIWGGVPARKLKDVPESVPE